MPTPGCSALILRVAVMPSISGMRTSIRMRSGRRRRHISMASMPFDASPITSRSDSPLKRLLKPLLSRWWSSARMSRLLLSIVIRLRQLDLGFYGSAPSRLAVESELTAQQGYPLAHAREADLLAAAVYVRRPVETEAAPLVPDQEPDGVARTVENHARLRGLGVFAYVREGFLGDPEERGLDLRGQAPVAKGLLEADLQALGSQDRDLEADGGGQAEVI